MSCPQCTFYFFLIVIIVRIYFLCLIFRVLTVTNSSKKCQEINMLAGAEHLRKSKYNRDKHNINIEGNKMKLAVLDSRFHKA